MQTTIPSALKLFIRMIPYWILVMAFYYLIRLFGVEQTPGIEVTDPIYRSIASNFILIRMGIVAALIYTVVEVFGALPAIRKLPLGMIILMKILATFTLILVLSYLVIAFFRPAQLGGPDWNNLFSFKPFWSLLLYFLVMSMIASFIRLMISQFGRDQFLRIITGRYRKPLQERRIFLFIDLKSSVSYAEKLGHLKYSELIQHCFAHLDASVLKYKGEIYQYVGDEAVVNWAYSDGISDNTCIACFADFLNRIHVNQQFYLDQYGFTPEFKAGLHGGYLTAAEVGVSKKEIAYHGDVINTASRIQETCNLFSENLLVSLDLASDLAGNQFRSVGDVSLKGKREKIELFAMAAPLA